MKTTDLSDFIERYLSGEMSDPEKVWFKKELEGNKELQAEVNLRRSIDHIMEKSDVIALRNKLSKIEKEKKAPVRSGRPKRTIAIRYAAIIAILISIGTIALLSTSEINNDKIISSYYPSYQPPAMQRSGTAQTLNEFRQAVDLYNMHEFGDALTQIALVPKNDPDYFHSLLLKGVVNFESKKYPEAQESFLTIIDDNNNLFIEDANWYLSGCYIMTGQLEKAVQLLNKIKTENSIYSDNALKIIKKIK